MSIAHEDKESHSVNDSLWLSVSSYARAALYIHARIKSNDSRKVSNLANLTRIFVNILEVNQ